MRLELTRGPGTERCPDERFLRAETARHMGFDPFEAEAPLTVAVSLEQGEGELIASIYLRDRRGLVLWADGFRTRDDCKALVSTAALSIAVQLDDTGELAPPPGGRPSDQAPPARPSGEAPPARPPGEAPPPSSAGQAAAERSRWTAGAGATLALGLTPGVAVGPTLAVTARWPAWSVALEARGLSSLSTHVEDVRVTTSALNASAALCLHRHVLFACGVGELGVLRAAPEVPLNPASLLGLHAGVGARAGVTWPFSASLSGYGYTEAVQRLVDWSLLRHRSITESEDQVWRPPAIGVMFGLGLQLNL
ncbi:hypothetical protein [Sorangium sp. So ce513]|uniref:hypothetical protein n=1 Tax=Sorangium sp. So ce513 TaxID=3133315 RepID=UPI003F5F3A5F